ncbi:hypothetical protein OAU49_02795 [Alphaproteobacteria bacterium]|nr:hypothetical protein [Alphaproteobacteria bacterium]
MKQTNNKKKIQSMNDVATTLKNEKRLPEEGSGRLLKDNLPFTFFRDLERVGKFNPNDEKQMKSLVAIIGDAYSYIFLGKEYGDDLVDGYDNILRVMNGIEFQSVCPKTQKEEQKLKKLF